RLQQDREDDVEPDAGQRTSSAERFNLSAKRRNSRRPRDERRRQGTEQIDQQQRANKRGADQDLAAGPRIAEMAGQQPRPSEQAVGPRAAAGALARDGQDPAE